MLLRYSCPSIKADLSHARELLRVAFPLFGSEGDEGGRAEQELVHLEQLLSQGVEWARRSIRPSPGAHVSQCGLIWRV